MSIGTQEPLEDLGKNTGLNNRTMGRLTGFVGMHKTVLKGVNSNRENRDGFSGKAPDPLLPRGRYKSPSQSRNFRRRSGGFQDRDFQDRDFPMALRQHSQYNTGVENDDYRSQRLPFGRDMSGSKFSGRQHHQYNNVQADHNGSALGDNYDANNNQRRWRSRHPSLQRDQPPQTLSLLDPDPFSSQRRRAISNESYRSAGSNGSISRTREQCFKTKLCHFFVQRRCTRGEDCFFAHSNVELRHTPDLSKTKMCAKWKKGLCTLDAADCAYAHGEHDLKPSNNPVFHVPLLSSEVTPEKTREFEYQLAMRNSPAANDGHPSEVPDNNTGQTNGGQSNTQSSSTHTEILPNQFIIRDKMYAHTGPPIMLHSSRPFNVPERSFSPTLTVAAPPLHLQPYPSQPFNILSPEYPSLARCERSEGLHRNEDYLGYQFCPPAVAQSGRQVTNQDVRGTAIYKLPTYECRESETYHAKCCNAASYAGQPGSRLMESIRVDHPTFSPAVDMNLLGRQFPSPQYLPPPDTASSIFLSKVPFDPGRRFEPADASCGAPQYILHNGFLVPVILRPVPHDTIGTVNSQFVQGEERFDSGATRQPGSPQQPSQSGDSLHPAEPEDLQHPAGPQHPRDSRQSPGAQQHGGSPVMNSFDGKDSGDQSATEPSTEPPESSLPFSDSARS